MKKLFAYILAFVMALFCAATILSPAVAGAETHRTLLYKYDVELGSFEGEPALLIVYQWQGEEHSFAWDELKISPWRPIWIELTETGACYDADYIRFITKQELPSGSLLFYFNGL